jgi:hypothetical protein
MPERRNEHECFDLRAADLDRPLAKVDLQLSPRWRLSMARDKRTETEMRGALLQCEV